MTVDHAPEVLDVWHVIKGEPQQGGAVDHRSADGVCFATPQIDLGELVWSRSELGPAFDVPVAEILELLAATGEAIRNDTYGYMNEAYSRICEASTFGPSLLERLYADVWTNFDPDRLLFAIEQELGGVDVIDGWRKVQHPRSRGGSVRAFPPRLAHIIAGNVPMVGPSTIAKAAVIKSMSLIKLPSNDLFTTPATLRTMAALAPGHPVVRSFSCVYWKGGDEQIESVLFRSQFFDKLVAWGGEGTIRGALKYVGPGFELVSFDPKTSISFVGREAFESDATVREAAVAAAIDASSWNQEACASARVQFVEGTLEQVDQFCEELVGELGVERELCTATGPRVPTELREEIKILARLEPYYRMWGSYDGSGLVLRSDEPVDFYPTNRVVNVVAVASLDDAVKFANVATQTVGIYPPSRKDELRDALAGAGVQRIVTLGHTAGGAWGMPHDGMFELQRMVRWVGQTD